MELFRNDILFYRACLRGIKPLVKLLVEEYKVPFQNYPSSLAHVIYLNHIDIAHYLIDQGMSLEDAEITRMRKLIENDRFENRFKDILDYIGRT